MNEKHKKAIIKFENKLNESIVELNKSGLEIVYHKYYFDKKKSAKQRFVLIRHETK